MIPLPEGLRQLSRVDPDLATAIGRDFERLAAAAQALAWSRDRLAALLAPGDEAGLLAVLVDEARALTEAPRVVALTWTGDLAEGRASVRSLAGDGETGLPADLSRTVIAEAVRSGRPVWSADAAADARFLGSRSVRALTLRSVGCVPLGDQGALYLADPDTPDRFHATDRARLAALGALVGTVLQARGAPVAVEAVPFEPLPDLVGTSAAMRALSASVRAFAPMPWPALVLGETGTGKEAVARALHALSPRSAEPFVAVNCAAIPEGLADSALFGHEKGAFTGADRAHEGFVARAGAGTLFLDEIGELAPLTQARLLRLLQEGTYERVGGRSELRFAGRVVAATWRALDTPAGRGDFRDDLFHRLAACVIRVPALAERREDVPALAEHLLARATEDLHGRPLALSPEASRRLAARPWPGNVRELENALRGAVARAVAAGAAAVGPEHLEATVDLPLSLPPTEAPAAPTEAPAPDADLEAETEAFQRRVVERALAITGGNRTAAAARLGVSRQWLHKLLARWEEG